MPRIMVINQENEHIVLEVTEDYLHNMVMTERWERNTFLDQSSQNPERLPVFVVAKEAK